MMFRVAFLIAIAASLTPVSTQNATAHAVWKVVWQDMSASDGTTTRVPVFVYQERRGDHERLRAPAEIAAVVRADERFRVARAGRDAEQLTHLVSEDFYGTDADGNGIDRQRLLDLVIGSTIRGVESRSSELRLAAGAVIVSGEQQIATADGQQRTQFVRIYSQDAHDHQWLLISSVETRPKS